MFGWKGILTLKSLYRIYFCLVISVLMPSGTAEWQRVSPDVSDVSKPGTRCRRRREGSGGRATGATEEGPPWGGHASRAPGLSVLRPGQLETETLLELRPVRCS